MSRGMGGHADGEPADRPGQLHQLDGVAQLTGPGPGVRRGVAAQGHEVLDPRLAERHQDLGQLEARVGHAHQVRHRVERGRAQDPGHQVVGALADSRHRGRSPTRTTAPGAPARARCGRGWPVPRRSSVGRIRTNRSGPRPVAWRSTPWPRNPTGRPDARPRTDAGPDRDRRPCPGAGGPWHDASPGVGSPEAIHPEPVNKEGLCLNRRRTTSGPTWSWGSTPPRRLRRRWRGRSTRPGCAARPCTWCTPGSSPSRRRARRACSPPAGR